MKDQCETVTPITLGGKKQNRKEKHQIYYQCRAEYMFQHLYGSLQIQNRTKFYLSAVIEIHVESVDMNLGIKSLNGIREKPSWT